VVVNALYSDENLEFAGTKAVRAVALDPDYVKRNTRELTQGAAGSDQPACTITLNPCRRRFAAGGQDGQLVLKTKGWFGAMKDVLLHSNEGPITAIRCVANMIESVKCHNLPRVTRVYVPRQVVRGVHRLGEQHRREDLRLQPQAAHHPPQTAAGEPQRGGRGLPLQPLLGRSAHAVRLLPRSPCPRPRWVALGLLRGRSDWCRLIGWANSIRVVEVRWWADGGSHEL
jgi:hypothetical protein